MIEITSQQNQVLKHIRKLYTNSYREKCGETVLEGERLVLDCAAYGGMIKTVLLREGYCGKVPPCDTVFQVSQKLFDDLAETKSPQGILAVAKAEFSTLESLCRGGLVLLCDRVQDPGNLGTIFRTAHAVGANGILLLKGSADPYAPKTVRASMGSVFAVPIARTECFPEMPAYTSFCGILSDTAKSLYSVEFPKATMLVLGNEANGASDTVIHKVNQHVTIPMPGGAESLNVAVAGAVMMYEYFRQVQHV